MPRYLFVLPDVDTPTGGVNVALHMVKILCDSGYEAAVVNGHSSYRYRFFETAARPFFYSPLTSIPRIFMGHRRRFQISMRSILKLNKDGPNPELTLRQEDVIVIPEFWYPEYSAVFPENRKVLLVQDVFGFCRALRRDRSTGSNLLDRFSAVVTTSAASHFAVSQLASLDSFTVLQSVSRPGLDAGTRKRRQIAYMPRKRPEEADILTGCLQGKPAFEDWTFRRIENVSPAELDRILSESLVFLSFSYQEGFGLPPAEAMAAGCIVIGYTGVGGEEYFQVDYGIPIPDGDIARFAAALEEVVTEYTINPTRLDNLRFKAAEFISKRYNPETMRTSMLSVWEKIDKLVSSKVISSSNCICHGPEAAHF